MPKPDPALRAASRPSGLKSIDQVKPSISDPADIQAKPRKPKNGRYAKDRGTRYELELAKFFTDALGMPVTRTPLSGGGRFAASNSAGQPDLIGLPGLWPEAKRTNRLNVQEALAQTDRARLATSDPSRPLVLSRRDGQPIGDSLAIMRLSDFVPLYAAWLAVRGYTKGA